MRTATGGIAAGMSANAAAASPLMIAAAGGQSYQYAALGTSQLLTQDSTGIGFPVSHWSYSVSFILVLAQPTSHGQTDGTDVYCCVEDTMDLI